MLRGDLATIIGEDTRFAIAGFSMGGLIAGYLASQAGRLAGIWGEFDATAAPYLAERRDRLRQFRPDASFDIIRDAGHWVQYEAHTQFNCRLRELVRGE